MNFLSDKVLSITANILIVVYAISMNVFGFLLVCLHLLTTFIAFTTSGTFAGLISFVFPIISTLYWFIKIWYINETVWSLYCMIVVGWILGALIFVLIPVLAVNRIEKITGENYL